MNHTSNDGLWKAFSRSSLRCSRQLASCSCHSPSSWSTNCRAELSAVAKAVRRSKTEDGEAPSLEEEGFLDAVARQSVARWRCCSNV